VRFRFFQAAVVAALSVFVAFPAAQGPTAASYTVVTRTGRQPLAVRVVNGQEMFSLDDLARLFALTVRDDTLAGGITVSANNQTIVMTPQQPLASIGGRMISLPAPPVREGRTWLVPVDFVARALAPVSQQRIELRKPSRLLLVGDVRIPRVAARSEALGAVTRVTVDVAPATPHTVSQDGTRLLLRFDADALDIGDIRITPGDVLQGLHPGDSPSILAFDLGPRFASFRVSDQPPPAPNAGRVVVELLAQTEAAPGGQPTAVPPGQPPPAEPPLLDLPSPGGLRTIVIDPGHGGDDPGAKGANGTLEKNVTLAIARKLKASLESRLGVRVMLTRESDQNISVDQRAALANNNKADIFLSIHASASVRPGTSGAEVFSLIAGDDAARAGQGTSESLPVLGGGNRDIQVIPWETAQARFLDQSASLARTLAAALREHVAMSPRALVQAPLRVLVGANTPAALVETGFLTNPAQEKQLAGDDYQNAIVAALVDGIVRFRAAGAGAAR
jgi:N-acetylmuramoyl-L-alanine amidase